MKRCKDCKSWPNPCKKNTPYGWAGEVGGGKTWECYSRKWWKFWAPKVLLITLALVLTGCVHVKLPDGTEYWRVGEQQIGEVLLEKPDGTTFLMDGQKSGLPKVEITATSIIISGKEVKP